MSATDTGSLEAERIAELLGWTLATAKSQEAPPFIPATTAQTPITVKVRRYFKN
jgi:hypothetical protein